MRDPNDAAIKVTQTTEEKRASLFLLVQPGVFN